MKLLLFSDLHCDIDAAQKLVEQADDADVLIGAGDFATCRRGIESTLDVLRAVERPAVLVPGNAESDDELRAACQRWPSAHVLHGSGTKIDGIEFYGLGAAVPETPFGSWSFDLNEEEARRLLVSCPSGAILVTHSPPQGVVDRTARGDRIGSAAIREVIEQKRPALAVCGHIHDSAGQSGELQRTPVVNAGPRGVIWELPAADRNR
jgi:Icc-related predicted phosphoesterase